MRKIKIRFRKNSWIIIPVLFIAWFLPGKSIRAENSFGILTTVYNNSTFENIYNSSPPLPPTTPIIGEFIQSRIENYFDQQPLFDLYDDFVVRYEGNIIAPCTCDIQLSAQADDGTILYLDNELITSDWYDKGSGGSFSNPISFIEGQSKHIVLWFYENGGGAWVQLWWSYNQQWSIVPDSAFILNELISTPVTDPTVPETTTTEVTVPETTVPEITTTTQTTIQKPIVPQTSTTVVEIITTTSSSTTTTIPIIEEPVRPIDNSNVKDVINKLTSSDVSPSEIISILDNSNLSNDNIQEIINTIIDIGIDSSLAQQLATNNTVINSIDTDQASQIFENIKISELSDDEKILLQESLSSAPSEIKNTFENTINIFGEGLDKYVPLGSKVDVKTRRIIIAATAAVSTVSISGMRTQSGGQNPPTNNASQFSGNSESDNSARRRRK